MVVLVIKPFAPTISRSKGPERVPVMVLVRVNSPVGGVGSGANQLVAVTVAVTPLWIMIDEGLI